MVSSVPAENFRRVNLDLLYPPFLERVLELNARCLARGVRYVATMGVRTYEEQNDLWRQGRTKPGAVVTNAKGGESQHNFGLAVDFVLDSNPSTDKVEPIWEADGYKMLSEQATLLGLHSGWAYNDLPHVGWPLFIGTETVPSLRVLNGVYSLQRGADLPEKLKRVWEEVAKWKIA